MAVAVTVPLFGRVGKMFGEVTAATAASNAVSGETTSEATTGVPWKLVASLGRESLRTARTIVACRAERRWDISARSGDRVWALACLGDAPLSFLVTDVLRAA